MKSPILLVILLVGVDGTGTPAHIQSIYGQLVTSSTLVWQKSGTGVDIPEEAVPSGTGTGVICRAREYGTNFLGVTASGRCQVGVTSRLVTKTRYEVLTEVTGAAKLVWQPFSKFSSPAKGAVAGVEGDNPVFVARKLGRQGTMLPAVVEVAASSFGTGIIKVFTDFSVEDVEDGDILVEVEPVRYQISLRQFTKTAKRTETKKVLASSSIFRFTEGRETSARMQKMLSYSFKKTQYFGQVRGTIKGLPVKINLPTGDHLSLLWGMQDTTVVSDSIMVGFDMKQNSAVDVVVNGIEVEEEQPYTASLVAVFPDGSVREREIEGTIHRKYVQHIRPQYSKLYVIKDQVMGVPSKLSDNGDDVHQVEVHSRQQSRSIPREEHQSLAVFSRASRQPTNAFVTFSLILVSRGFTSF